MKHVIDYRRNFAALDKARDSFSAQVEQHDVKHERRDWYFRTFYHRALLAVASEIDSELWERALQTAEEGAITDMEYDKKLASQTLAELTAQANGGVA